MKILVYGAGVIGCELAHCLCQNLENSVTILARGIWKENLAQNGLVIRHVVQCRTTTDQVSVIDNLPKNAYYDLIFVVMQSNQLPQVLPTIAQNSSPYVVLVGNNAQGALCEATLTENHPTRQVAFGFQGTAGRRENGKVVSIHAAPGMTVGALHGMLDDGLKKQLKICFSGVKYQLSFESDMDAWLKAHLLFIMPISYVCYAVGCHLPRASRAQRKAILDAALEGCQLLHKLGIPIRAEENDDYYRPGAKRKKMELLVFLMAKTPLGRLAVSDHCQHAVAEMQALDETFEAMRQQAGYEMPVWKKLRADGNPANFAKGNSSCPAQDKHV